MTEKRPSPSPLHRIADALERIADTLESEREFSLSAWTNRDGEDCWSGSIAGAEKGS